MVVVTDPKCPRCGGTPDEPEPVCPPGANPWAWGPGMRFPDCTHPYHEEPKR